MTDRKPVNILILDGEDAIAATASFRPVGESTADSREQRLIPSAPPRRVDPDDPNTPAAAEESQLPEGERAEAKPVMRAVVRHPSLRTEDGMQLYRFIQRFPYEPREKMPDPDKRDPNHQEYWGKRLREALPPGETLNALIVPSNIGPTSAGKMPPLYEAVKAEWPGVKIIRMGQPGEQPDHKLIDAVAPRQGFGNFVRGLLSVPLLPDPDPTAERRARATARANRLIAAAARNQAPRDR